jgi:hypothetical protein
MARSQVKIVRVRPADENSQVVTIHGGSGGYRRKPCAKCPWRVDAIGEFPAEAFRHSANTSYDMAEETFGCHESGTKNPVTCAGFLLRNADHNMKVRIAQLTGQYKNDVKDGGHALHVSYRAMAVANGVAPDDPALAQCRDNGYENSAVNQIKDRPQCEQGKRHGSR